MFVTMYTSDNEFIHMHHILERQIKQHFKNKNINLAEVEEFFNIISKTYQDFDADRESIIETLEVSVRELGENVALLQSTFDSVDEGILTVNKDLKIGTHNRQFIDLFDVPEDMLRSRDSFKVLHHIEAIVENKKPLQQFLHHLNEGSLSETNDIVLFLDGRVVHLLSKPLLVSGSVDGRVLVARDISTQENSRLAIERKAFELEQLNTIMIDREIKMVDLKHEIENLKRHTNVGVVKSDNTAVV